MILGLSHSSMALMKKMNKLEIRIKISRLKTTRIGLSLSKKVNLLNSHENMLALNRKTEMEVTSTKQQAQNKLGEIHKSVHSPINLNFNCQITKLPKVILPETSAVMKQEEEKTESNAIEVIDLCSSEDEH